MLRASILPGLLVTAALSIAAAIPASAGSLTELKVSGGNRAFLTQMTVRGASGHGMKQEHGMKSVTSAYRAPSGGGHPPASRTAGVKDWNRFRQDGKPLIIRRGYLGDHGGKPGKPETPVTIIRNSNENSVTVENNITVETGIAQRVDTSTGNVSGGIDRRHGSKGYGHGMREIAGRGRDRGPVLVTRSTDNSINPRIGFSNSGLIVLNITNGAPAGGMSEVAGAGRAQDCAYGTYCTIDLGGPKIITFNDVATIEDGAIVDETMSEQEMLERYGSK